MISDYSRRSFAAIGDDDGVYYCRQLDAADGDLDFEGIVWCGQQFERDPSFANVYIGRLRRRAGVDSNGHRIDKWEGRYFDVPRGCACGAGRLDVESLVVPSLPVALCDFPEHYIVRRRPSRFAGRVVADSLLSPCWPVAFERGLVDFEPPPPGPRNARAVASGAPTWIEEAAALGSRPLPAGFERSGAADLTGTWRGDDDGSYYLTSIPATNEVVWYAEHPSARPQVGPEPPVGWANVFFGIRSEAAVRGLWADLPKGLASRAGRLTLAVEDADSIRISRQTGGYGGRLLSRVKLRDVTVSVDSVTVRRTGENSGDEPLVYLAFFKLDGDTVDLGDLRSSTATVSGAPSGLRLGTDVRGEVAVPPDRGRWRTTLATVRGGRAAAASEDATRIGVVMYAIEVDPGYADEFHRTRFATWIEAQRYGIDSVLRDGRLPDLEDLRRRANRILVRVPGAVGGLAMGRSGRCPQR